MSERTQPEIGTLVVASIIEIPTEKSPIQNTVTRVAEPVEFSGLVVFVRHLPPEKRVGDTISAKDHWKDQTRYSLFRFL
jgi:hypothetical protein